METLEICKEYTKKHNELVKEQNKLLKRVDDKLESLQKNRSQIENKYDELIIALSKRVELDIIEAMGKKDAHDVVTTYEITCNQNQQT